MSEGGSRPRGVVTPFPSRGAIRARSYDPDADTGDNYSREAPAAAFEPFYASEMEGQEPEPRRWMVDGVCERGTVLLFAGPTKIGKSLLMQQLMTSTTLGRPWLGVHCERARTLALYGEDPHKEVVRRQAQINAHYDCSPADYELDLAWQSLAGQPARLVEFDRGNRPILTPLFHQAKRFTLDNGVQMVGLDNARVLFGGNENWPNHVEPFLRILTAWAMEIDGVIVLPAHPAKNDPKGFSGTGAWLSSVRAGMSLRRPDDWELETHGLHDPRRVLSGLGSNYGPGIRTERIDYDAGVFIVSDRQERQREATRPLTTDERRDMRYHLVISMRQYLHNGMQIYADFTHKTRGLPILVARSPTKTFQRITIGDVELMQKEMLDAGQIERVDVGGRCLLRPTDGPFYKNEQPWLLARPLDHAAD